MQFFPLGDRIMVRRNEAMRTTESGLYIPENATEKASEGVVIAVGPGRQLDDGKISQMHVTVGDTVLWGKYAGSETEFDGQMVLIMRQEELLGRIVREQAPEPRGELRGSPQHRWTHHGGELQNRFGTPEPIRSFGGDESGD